jgi:hypothetical protein
MGEKIKVLYVAGEGRSGSTLLGRMLGELPGFLMCGETKVLWTQNRNMGDTSNACACQTPLDDCVLWGSVLDEMDMGADAREEISASSYAFFKRSRLKSLLEILRPGSAITPDIRLRTKLVQLYRYLANESGTNVIVDTSKTPALALLLLQLEEIDLRVIHLVRDSRGVAFSWTKKIMRTDVGRNQVRMRRAHPLLSVLRWNLTQYLVPRLRDRDCPVLLVRYEDMIAAPRESLINILRFADEQSTSKELNFVTDERVCLQAGHSLMGNPNRIRQGWVQLRKDDAWRQEMPRLQRLLVTIISFPYLLRHRYLFRQNDNDAA